MAPTDVNASRGDERSVFRRSQPRGKSVGGFETPFGRSEVRNLAGESANLGEVRPVAPRKEWEELSHSEWDWIDYMTELHHKPSGRSVLKSVWAMFRYSEAVSGVSSERCHSRVNLVRQMFEGVLSNAASGTSGSRAGKAPRVW